MTDQEVKEWKERIDKMSHIEMARLYRFAPAGHPCFNTQLPLHEYFAKRFASLGGMTCRVSKAIGW